MSYEIVNIFYELLQILITKKNQLFDEKFNKKIIFYDKTEYEVINPLLIPRKQPQIPLPSTIPTFRESTIIPRADD